MAILDNYAWVKTLESRFNDTQDKEASCVRPLGRILNDKPDGQLAASLCTDGRRTVPDYHHRRFLWRAFVRGSLIVAGDAAATAQKIMASESLFRSGVTGDLLMHVCDVPLTLIFYVLLRPVSKEISLLAAVFSLLQTAILCANKLNLITVLLLLKRADYMKAFEPNQLQALASLSLTLHGYGFGIGLIFFGVSCLCVGYLMFKSGYFRGVWALCRQLPACAT